MKYRNIMILLILAIFILSVAGAGASDVDDSTIKSDNIEKISVDDSEIGQTSNDELIGDAVNGTFHDLENKIKSGYGSEITLDMDYTANGAEYENGIPITDSITIDGKGHTIDANSASRIFSLDNDEANVVLTNIVFINGNSYDGGGAIFSDSTLEIINCSFADNFAESGGAIFSSGSLVVKNSDFTQNCGHWMGGGAIYSSGDLTVDGCNFIENDAPDFDHQGNIGGAIYALGPLNVLNSYFENNTAGSGDEKRKNAIYAYELYTLIKNTTFVNNAVSYNKFNSYFDLNLSSSLVPAGENVTIFVEFEDKNITGNLSIYINDDERIVDIVNGSANLELSDLADGTYVVEAVYPESEYRWGYTQTNKFNVYSGSYIIDAQPVVKYYGGYERFVVYLYDSKENPLSGENVNITLNGVDYLRTTDEYGYASLGVNLNRGKYDVVVQYRDYAVNSSVTVKSTVIGENVTKMFRNATAYYAKFLTPEGYYLPEDTTVEFNINGVLYKRNVNADSVAKLNINLNPGEYVITATNPVSGEMYSNVITILPTIVDNYDLTKYYRNDSQYSIRLLDGSGNPVGAGEKVVFNINGVMYERTSNASGHVKMNINLNPGTYIITANYNGLMASNTIKVLPVLSAKDVNMKYRDGTKFEAKLVDGQGNPFAAQKITFNINGVFYERTTDADGIARLNINLQVGEYIITSTFNGANIANNVKIEANVYEYTALSGDRMLVKDNVIAALYDVIGGNWVYDGQFVGVSIDEFKFYDNIVSKYGMSDYSAYLLDGNPEIPGVDVENFVYDVE